MPKHLLSMSVCLFKTYSYELCPIFTAQDNSIRAVSFLRKYRIMSLCLLLSILSLWCMRFDIGSHLMCLRDKPKSKFQSLDLTLAIDHHHLGHLATKEKKLGPPFTNQSWKYISIHFGCSFF